jgi:uncharacterized protein YihD (DUF1040 family)
MRDPKRIHEMLRVISKVWYKNPDLRLGQLILNAVTINPNLYYMEDEQLLEYLKKTYKEE